MKSFSKNQKTYVSLQGLDPKIIEKLNNINNKQINECCGCCCDGEKCCEPTSSSFIYFYSEYEVTNRLKTNVKVQDLFDINRQFLNKQFMFGGASPADTQIPLYFKEPSVLPGSFIPGGIQPAPTGGTEYNAQLYGLINTLLKQYNMGYPTVLTRSDNSVQLFFVKGCGSNGQECSIKSSLIEVAELLDDLDNMEEITWSQVLDASIDNLDDVYNFVITCTIDINKF